MQHLINERRSVLVQDIRELTTIIFPKLIQIYNQLLNKGLVTVTATDLYYWMLCELIEKQYCYSVTKHNHNDPSYSVAYDHIRNYFNNEKIGLETLFEFYIKGPVIYTKHHNVDVGLVNNGADIVFTFYWNESEFLKMKNILTH